MKKQTAIIDKADSKLRQIFEPMGLSVSQRPMRISKKGFWDRVYDANLKGIQGILLELGLCAKPTAEPRRVYELIGQLQFLNADDKKVHPLFFSPYIGERTAQLCRQAGIGYFDETGNCWISYKTILISQSSGVKPPAPRRKSRQLFAPKSTRVIRALLFQPLKGWHQSELAKEVKISLGLVNRIVRRLLDSAFLTLMDGRVYLKDRKALLDEWVKAETLQNNPAIEYYAAEPLTQFEQRLDELSRRENFQYSLTMFAGARYRAPFVRINRLHAYVQGDVATVARSLGLKPVSSGGNVLFIPAPDEGVFYGNSRIQDRNIVSDVQLYVDLKNAHGRGEEQAEAVAERCLQPIIVKRTIEQEAKLHEFLSLRDQGGSLFRTGDAVAAAHTLTSAWEILESLSQADKNRERNMLCFNLWLARLEAAYKSGERRKLEEADLLFPSDQEALNEQEQTLYNKGWVMYGLMLRAALRAKWEDNNNEARRKAVGDFYKYFGIVTSPYTENSNELKPKAEEIKDRLAL